MSPTYLGRLFFSQSELQLSPHGDPGRLPLPGVFFFFFFCFIFFFFYYKTRRAQSSITKQLTAPCCISACI